MHQTEWIRVGDRLIGEGRPTYVVAEMACAHEGSVDRALRLVEIAGRSGADGLQVQMFVARDMIAPTHPKYATVVDLEIGIGAWPDILRRARAVGLDVWANVFDETSLAVAVAEGVDVLKLHSTDLSNPGMLDAVARCATPVSLAAGGSTLDELLAAVGTLRRRGTPMILMHGFQAYPTPIEDSHLAQIAKLKTRYGCPVGYQDHTDGDSPQAFILPAVAIGLGADVVEKHFTEDRRREGVDYEASLNPDELERFVAMVREVDRGIGDDSERSLSPAEQAYRENFKKTTVAARPIQKGETITHDALAFLRAPQGLPPAVAVALVGKPAARAIDRYDTIRASDVVDTRRH